MSYTGEKVSQDIHPESGKYTSFVVSDTILCFAQCKRECIPPINTKFSGMDACLDVLFSDTARELEKNRDKYRNHRDKTYNTA